MIIFIIHIRPVLSLCYQGTFLVRYSAEAPGFMAITVLQSGEPPIKHYRIQHKYVHTVELILYVIKGSSFSIFTGLASASYWVRPSTSPSPLS